MLAGKEFELQTYTNGDIVAEWAGQSLGYHLRLVSKEYDGIIMPEPNAFKPEVGDTYALFNISVPYEYYRDDSNLTGAEWEMFKEAIMYLYEHEDEQYTFSGKIDPIFAHDNWDSLPDSELGFKDYLGVGQHIRFADNIITDPIVLRVSTLKEYINKQYEPDLTLSNLPPRKLLSTTINKDRGSQLRGDLRPWQVDMNEAQEAIYTRDEDMPMLNQ